VIGVTVFIQRIQSRQGILPAVGIQYDGNYQGWL